MYIHTCMHTYMNTYIHAYIHAYIHTYIHTYIQPLPLLLQTLTRGRSLLSYKYYKLEHCQESTAARRYTCCLQLLVCRCHQHCVSDVMSVNDARPCPCACACACPRCPALPRGRVSQATCSAPQKPAAWRGAAGSPAQACACPNCPALHRGRV